MKKLKLITALFLATYWSGPVFGQTVIPETFFIEAEDHDGSSDGITGDLHANFGDPACSLAGKTAITGVNYFEVKDYIEPDAVAGAYRPQIGVETKPDRDHLDRDGVEITCNYIVGWNESGDWYNYTRIFGQESVRYNFYASMASGSSNGLENAELAIISSNPTQPNQTKTVLGTFLSPASGGWDIFHLVPLRDNSGNLVSVRLKGTNTLRFTSLPGAFDVDYIELRPAPVQLLPPNVSSVTPQNGGYADYGTNTQITVVINDEDAKVLPSMIKLWVDGVEVTSNTAVTDTAVGATVRYKLLNVGELYKEHEGKLEFKDDTDNTNMFTWNWFNSPYDTNNLFIEAEDFNVNGNYFPSNPSGAIPFNVKGLYAGEGAGVMDYKGDSNTDANANVYRIDETPNISLFTINDSLVRGAGPRVGFTDYRIGYVDPGEWWNYTRYFPKGRYRMYARLSSGGADSHLLLHQVDNAVVAPESQVRTLLGQFDAKATGSYNTFRFAPLKNSEGNIVTVSLDGEQTLRVTANGGNFDINYLMLIPAPPIEPPTLSINRDGDGVIIRWEGGGVLQVAGAVSGPWTDVADGKSPYRLTNLTEIKQFWRVVLP